MKCVHVQFWADGWYRLLLKANAPYEKIGRPQVSEDELRRLNRIQRRFGKAWKRV